MAQYDGDDADNSYVGTANDDTIHGNGGNDVLDGGGGSDVVHGGAGRDRISGGTDQDYLYAGDSHTEQSTDWLSGGGGDDILTAGYGDTVDGGDGYDLLFLDYSGLTFSVDIDLSRFSPINTVTIGGGAISGVEYLRLLEMTDLADRYTAYDAAISSNLVYGRGGNDVMNGAAGSDSFNGGDGDDQLFGGKGSDNLSGDQGVDRLEGGDGDDSLDGGTDSDADTMLGGVGDDLIYAGRGDTVDGGTGTDRLAIDFGAAGSGVTADFSALATGGSVTIGTAVISGMEQLELIGGSAFADRLTFGDASFGTISYAARLSGGGGDDILTGGVNRDEIRGGTDHDTLYGLANGDQLFGETGDDLIEGGAGEDFLYGGIGADRLDGGDGNDSLDAGDVDIAERDVLIGGAGDDYLGGGIGDDVDGGVGNDRMGLSLASLTAGVSIDFAGMAQGGSVTIAGATVRGIERVDLLTLTRFDDIVSATSLTGAVIAAGRGNDAITGSAGADDLRGEAGDDSLVGGAGNDRLYGGDGTDLLEGGAGDDLLEGQQYIGSTGWGDAASYASATGAVTVSLAKTGRQNTGAAGWDTLVGIERLIGSNFDDTLTGQNFYSVLEGGEGNDRLIASAGGVLDGGAGMDTLVSSSWGDNLTGGEGIDTVDYGASTAGVIVYLESGMARDGYAEGDLFWGIENLTGSAFDDYLFGTDDANRLDGGNGDDIIVGEGGNDTVVGGAGDDYFLGSAGDGDDRIDGGSGSDILEFDYDMLAGVSVNLQTGQSIGAGSDRLTGIEHVRATRFDDVLTGSAADNRLYGGKGADVIAGGSGNDELHHDTDYETAVTVDRIDGGDGNDRVTIGLNDIATGGTGTDMLFIDMTRTTQAARIDLSAMWSGGTGVIGTGTISGFELVPQIFGTDAGDTITIGTNGTLAADTFHQVAAGRGDDRVTGGDDRDFLIGEYGDDRLYGLGGNDQLWGGDDADFLDGGSGADEMLGDGGDDIFQVDDASDQVIEVVGQGIDTVFASISFAVGAQDIEKVTLTGQNDLSATGNGLANVLTGNAGHNILDGGADADRMVGGAGNDTYHIDDAGDRVVEAVDGGVDTAISSVSVDFGTVQLDNLTLTGSANLFGYGNALTNVLTGNAGANVLNGRAGADRMVGGRGDDTYHLDSAGDRIVELAGEGADTAISSVSVDFGTVQLDNLTLTGSANLYGYGNGLANVLTGNAGANVLNGRGGADRMVGGAGSDTYHLDDAGDRIVELAGGGIDTAISSVSVDFGTVQLENLTLTGTAALHGYGNASDNALVGNAGANTLRGRGGNDVLTGAAGRDQFLFDTAFGADNVDRITDFRVGEDTLQLSRAVFGGIARGQLSADAFRAGTSATDASDRIIHDAPTGDLFYDADGNGAGAAVLFATVSAGLALDHASIFGV